MANRLARESSPYLLQHKDNPVDWYPWSDEAFDLARREDKPIFLSIGYSTCHWCHVMEHESFEDDGVARLMNEAFVNIKVDREERPDIDHTYMSVCQIIGEHCGWPLNVVMTPGKKPFVVGTYFPKETRGGRIGMLDLVPRLERAWKEDRDKVEESATNITSALDSLSTFETSPLDSEWRSTAVGQLSSTFDRTNGGFSSRPKFPSPHTLLFLLRAARRGESSALSMVTLTLDRMATGGIHDHVGGGFHRYATDTEWRLPHFEKMLYDQALLAIAYAEAWQVTGFVRYQETAERILGYLKRDLSDGDGLFYAAEDADSEGVEGKFYVWSRQEFDESASDLELSEFFDIQSEGNFLEEATGRRTGDNVLHATKAGKQYESDDSLYPEGAKAVLDKLLEVRSRRVRPSLDTKVLTDWNALAIVAFATCGRIFRSDEFVKDAEVAAGKLFAEFLETGRLTHVHNNSGSIDGLLDDYAFSVWAAIELYQVSFNLDALELAVSLSGKMISRFKGSGDGPLHFSSTDDDPVLVRTIEINDGALPSGNAIAAWNLVRLSRLTGDVKWEEYGQSILEGVATRISRYPSAFTASLIADDFLRGRGKEIVSVIGERDHEFETRVNDLLANRYSPESVFHVLKTDDVDVDRLGRIAPYTASMVQGTEKSALYVCQNFACNLPVTDVDGLAEALDS